MDDQRIIIRTPMKRLRVVIGLLCGASGLITVWAAFPTPGPSPVSWAIAVGLLAGGLAIALTDYTVVIDPSVKEGRASWCLAGKEVGAGKAVSLRDADRIKIGQVRMRMHYQPGRIFKADRAYPVWCMQGEEAILVLVGWPPPEEKDEGRGPWDTGLFNSAFFPEYSRHIAARAAKVLNLPLEDGPAQETLGPDQIPEAWLDPGRVRFKLDWRRN